MCRKGVRMRKRYPSVVESLTKSTAHRSPGFDTGGGAWRGDAATDGAASLAVRDLPRGRADIRAHGSRRRLCDGGVATAFDSPHADGSRPTPASLAEARSEPAFEVHGGKRPAVFDCTSRSAS